ncbi:hypothetical protein PVAP13_6KG224200 [Panicum virgatum]|nr:hypothetical protein PVAP13_6KG224200 [Panicum virgatum]
MEALPVVKLPLPKLPVHRSLPKLQVHRPLPKLEMRKPLQQTSLVLEQESLKQEMLVMLLTSATSINMMLNSQNRWTETLSGSKDKTPASIKNCKCRNSKCLKLYCGCFATGRYCKDCNCTNCSNNGSHENARARQDAINAVLECRTAAFMPKAGSRSCAMQSSETLLSFPSSVDDDKGLVSERNTHGHSELGPHEVTYRAVLADIVQVEDVNELCKLLILASRQAAEAFLDSGIMENTSTEKLDRAESCLSSTNNDREAVQKEPDIHACLPESSSYERHDTKKPVSPGSQVLLCNELDTVSQLSRAEDAIHSTTMQNLPDIFRAREVCTDKFP